MITAEKIVHKGEKRIAVRFPKDQELINKIKKIPGALWSQTKCTWHIPYTNAAYKELTAIFPEIKVIKKESIKQYKQLPQPDGLKLQKPVSTIIPEIMNEKKVEIQPEVIKKIHQFRYWLTSRRYSENTIKTYSDALLSFIKFHSNKSISEINNNDVIIYNNEYIIKKKLSGSYQNQVVNAIKIFFREIEKTKIDINLIHRPKREKMLPNVISKEEVKEILNNSKNIKHKTMLSLIYSCGLRRSELLNLKITDINSSRGLVIIKQSKGKKDRIVPLSGKIIIMLRSYYKMYKPVNWLFEGQQKGVQYSEKSLESVLKQALGRTNIRKPVSLHWLRHSYATHLLEKGTDLRYIQEILGHKSSRTTEIYTHVSTKNIQNIKSPFDDLEI